MKKKQAQDDSLVTLLYCSYVHCPLLKCDGMRSTIVCVTKCKRYKRAACPTIIRIYKEAGYEKEEKKGGNKRAKRSGSSEKAKRRGTVQAQGLREAGREKAEHNGQGPAAGSELDS